MATISRCPKVIRHDFPDEMLNYIDEKMEEGQYKKRFRYDRPDKNSKQTRSQTAILNMNSQDIFNKILYGKKEKKEPRFYIKPKQKINPNALHSALLKIKKQKEVLDEKLAIADKTKQVVNENDICMLANQGAINYILSQNLDIDEEVLMHNSNKKSHRVHKSKSHKSIPQMEDISHLLSVEGLSYNLAVSQSIVQGKIRPGSSCRPTSAFSTMRPTSSTKNYSEKGISEHLLQQYADFRNQLFEKIIENSEFEQMAVQVQVGNPEYLTPQTQMGFRGGKVPHGFMPKGLKRIHSAAATNIEFRPFVNPGEMLFQHETLPVSRRPQTAMLSKVQSSSRFGDHLKVIEEIKHQEDVSALKLSFDQSFREQQQNLQVQGKQRIQSAYPRSKQQ